MPFVDKKNALVYNYRMVRDVNSAERGEAYGFYESCYIGICTEFYNNDNSCML